MMGINSTPLAFSSLSLGVLFGLSNIAIARNPEMEKVLFTNSLIAFALMETFIFMNIGISFVVLVAF